MSNQVQNTRNFTYGDAMNCKQRLLILSCSQRKQASYGSLPAIDRYNGPLFFVLRRFLRECPRQARLLDVYILSAAYGLIPGNFPTALYDKKMNPSRAFELQSQVSTVFSDIRHKYASIYFVLGKTYLKTFEGLQDWETICTASVVAQGPIGQKQTQLKRWLWGEHPSTRVERNFDESGSD